MRRSLLILTVVLALVGSSSPARAGEQLTPSTFETEAWTPGWCGQHGSTGICTSTGTPGSPTDPVMRAELSVVDPADPVPVFGTAGTRATHMQTATQTLTRAVPFVTYSWTFVVDEALTGEETGRGTGELFFRLLASAALDDCDRTLPRDVFVTYDPVAAGTVYEVSWTLRPCAGMHRIPAGTTATLRAELVHDAKKVPEDRLWDGRYDVTGALRSASITSSCC